MQINPAAVVLFGMSRVKYQDKKQVLRNYTNYLISLGELRGILLNRQSKSANKETSLKFCRVVPQEQALPQEQSVPQE